MFGRQRTGERVFDLNADGVAHYGLFADLLADVQRHAGGPRALGLLFRSGRTAADGRRSLDRRLAPRCER